MTDQSSDSSKRVVRPRRRPPVAGSRGGAVSGESLDAPRGAMDEALEETAAIRADFGDRDLGEEVRPARRRAAPASERSAESSAEAVGGDGTVEREPVRRKRPVAKTVESRSADRDDEFGAGVDVDAPTASASRPSRASASPERASDADSHRSAGANGDTGERGRHASRPARRPPRIGEDTRPPRRSAARLDGDEADLGPARYESAASYGDLSVPSGSDGPGPARRNPGDDFAPGESDDGGSDARSESEFRGEAGSDSPGEGAAGGDINSEANRRLRGPRRGGRGGENGSPQPLRNQQQQPPRGRHQNFGGHQQGPRRGPSGGRQFGQQNHQGHQNFQDRPHQGGSRNSDSRSQEPRSQEPRSQEPRGPEIIEACAGTLELHPKGYGFLRDPKAGYVSQESDAFVSTSLIEKYKLREGVGIQGNMVAGGRGQGPRLKTIDYIDGRTPEEYALIKPFDELTAVNPFEQIRLETGVTPLTMRVMDLLTPIGKGQRALIVAPPRSGKTMLLQEIADAVSINHPEIYLIVLLIDERPEEVTDMRRRVKGEVIASSMDRDVESHIRLSQLVFERARRMTEAGRDVFVLLDSITRTARAFNKWSSTGRTMTGGLDVKAMDIPKKMFGTARRFEEGGSLTVVGTALVETGSKMDDVIFQEFKGTGNMEMVLSRDLAERRIWPAIDITRSGTRREEKILPPDVMEGVILLRRSLVSMSPVEAMENLIRILAKYKSNAEFLAKVRSIL